MLTTHFLESAGQTYRLADTFRCFFVSEESEPVKAGTVRFIDGNLFYADEYRHSDKTEPKSLFGSCTYAIRWISIVPLTWEKTEVEWNAALKLAMFGIK